METPPLFKEVQYFRQIWIWAIVLGIDALLIYGLIQQLIYKQSFGDNPMSDTGLIFTTAFTILMTLFFWVWRLETEIRRDGIYVRFFPIHLNFRYYSWEKIQRCYLRTYNPILEYGGWGLRGFGKNRALNVAGNDGIQLELENGAKLLIGTQQPDEAEVALRKTGHLHQ